MHAHARSPVPISIGPGGTDTAEGRAFIQARLSLFGGWVFLISGAFLTHDSLA